MSTIASSPSSTLVDATSHSMEELNEVQQADGWEGEIRQLGKGRVTSRWRSLSLGPCTLASHRLDKRVHARQTSPKGSVTLAIMPPPFVMLVDGAELGNGQVLVMDTGSEADFINPNEIECDILTLPKSDFVASARALFPQTRRNGGPIRILPGSSSK